MFWRFGGYANISTIDTILDKPDVTLEELLDESDLIQELKQQNSKLIEFLRDDERLKRLLAYVIAEPKSKEETAAAAALGGEADAAPGTPKSPAEDEKSTGISFFKGKNRARSKSANKNSAAGETEQEMREAQRKKHAYIACEVLSSEVWSISEALLEQRDNLRDFWQYLKRPAPLDPLQAGYFTKVNEALLDKKTEKMLDFFRSLEGIVPAMLQHVDCPMVMDLLLKIISLEKHEGGQGIVDWLQQQDLIPLLLAYLSDQHSAATQTSAGDFLKAIITISANATTQDQSVIGPNELTRQLVSHSCIQALIDGMLKGGNPLTVGVGIVIEVIRKNNSDYDLDNQVGPEPKTSDPIYLGTLLRKFATHVPDFMHLIRSSGAQKPELKTAFGCKIQPLGFDRFKTCELMAELLHCSNMGLLNERGADEEVLRRDEERERLKAEGKLATPRARQSPTPDISHDEFGSSVDSHGFHHAERPSDDDLSEKPEEARKLEVQNASDEDGFEKVNAPSDEYPEEVTFDDLNEKIDDVTHGDLPKLEKVDKRDPSDPQNKSPQSPMSPSALPQPLSPKKNAASLTKQNQPHFDPPPTHSVDSPTTAEATDRLNNLEVDEDTVMSEFGEEPEESGKQNALELYRQFLSEQPLSIRSEDGPSELERELARSAEKPAPLFVKKAAAAAQDEPNTSASESPQDIEQSTATLHAREPSTVSNGERAAYDTELDGSPVVGDLLKIKFVEHQVVPTILDFFFRFPWNNFLHNVVYDVVQQVFNGTLDRGYNRTLAFDLFTPAQGPDGKTAEEIGLASGKDITDRILDGQAKSDESQKHKGMRLGYMGHLTLIAEEVCKFGSKHLPETLDPIITERVSREAWISYVEGTLAETRDKDNAVLGGVRPENAMGIRATGMGGGGLSSGFSSNTQSTLAHAGLGGNSNMTPQDSLALQEGTVGQSFEINSGTMLSGFGDGDEDEEMEDEAILRERDRQRAFAEDEQDQTSADYNKNAGGAVQPLNIAPSRARRTLAARLAQKNQGKTVDHDSHAADIPALEDTADLPEEPGQLSDPTGSHGLEGLQITGLRTVSGAGHISRGSGSKFSGLFSSSDESNDDSDDSSFNGDDAGRDHALSRDGGGYDDADADAVADPGVVATTASSSTRRARRPSTTEATVRRPLDDGDSSSSSSSSDASLEISDLADDLPDSIKTKVVLEAAAAQRGFGGAPRGLDDIDDDDDDDDADDDDDDSSEDELVEIRPRRTS